MDWKLLEKVYPFTVFDPETKRSRSDEMTQNDMISLTQLLSKHQPVNILEIGCWTGSCTCLFGSFAKKHGGKVHCIDNFKGSPGSRQDSYSKIARRRFFENVDTFGLEDTVVFHDGFSDDFADLDMKFDLIFIDADHRYSQISKDIDNYFPKVNAGGILAGHDFNNFAYNEEYIEDDYVEGSHHGVTKAVRERFPDVLLFITPDGDKQKLISSVWHIIKKEVQAPCLVAVD